MVLLNSRVVRISTASLITGLLIGAVGGAFRLLLIQMDTLRNELVQWAHLRPYTGWLVPVAVGIVGAALARWLVVRFAPTAEGSGVQRVEAVFDGEAKPAPHGIVLVKFFGGLLAIGSGLALGREGPTVQMGASLSSIISALFGEAGRRCRRRHGGRSGRRPGGRLQRAHWRLSLCLRGADLDLHSMAPDGHARRCDFRRVDYAALSR